MFTAGMALNNVPSVLQPEEMKMIDKLTESQEVRLKEYRDKVFGYATSTVTDKLKAEAASLRLTDGVLVEPEIHWAYNPEEAGELFCSLRGSQQGSPRDSLCDSLSDLIRSLQGSPSGSPSGSLSGSLWSEWDSLFDSLHSSLLGSRWDSLWDSLRGSSFIAYYRFSEIAGIVKYEETVSMYLRCYEELNESCFAMYSLPYHIILLEKPKRVKVEDGKLIEIEW